MLGSLSCVSTPQFLSPFKLVSSSQIRYPLPWPVSEESMKLKYAFATLQGFLKISPEVPTSNYLCLDSICSPNLFLPVFGFPLWILLVSRFLFIPGELKCMPSILLFLYPFHLPLPCSSFPFSSVLLKEWSLVCLIQIPRSRWL